jgi:NTE family protein
MNAARLILLVVAFLGAACSRFSAVDEPLDQWQPDAGEVSQLDNNFERSPEMVVLLAFSGGGSRASALSYGVLKELAESSIPTSAGSSTVLAEVDMISAVSGGSFTAAYYGLKGDGIFVDYEDRFLRHDVEGALLLKLFNPANWVRLMSGRVGRSDLAADYYDKILFEGARFADLHRDDAPVVVLNSTDLATGTRFPFIQDSFDLICADLSVYPVSRAVAASSAVPVVFSPVTIKSYAGSCGYRPPAWLEQALDDEELTERKVQARQFSDYLDVDKRPWLHLVDGGIADNLGLRAFYTTLSLAKEPGSRYNELLNRGARQILIISVNAFAKKKPDWVLERYAPSTLEVMRRVSADQISRYSSDTIQIVRDEFGRLASDQSTPERPVSFHFVDVSFEQIDDDDERAFLNGIGTSMDLSDDQIDRLIAAGRTLVRESVEFKRFVEVAQANSQD